MLVVVLLAVLVFLVATSRLTPSTCPQPVPPPVVVDALGGGDTTPLGVPVALIRAIYSVVEPPECTSDPDRPQAMGVPDAADVHHIITQLARRVSAETDYRVAAGHVIHSTVLTDTEGVGTYLITMMLHEAERGTTMRIRVKARMPVGSRDAPRFLNISFDPQEDAPDEGEPCRAGRVPRPKPGLMDMSIYT
jgi:hypothetical protein